jgi:hypothetical protein
LGPVERDPGDHPDGPANLEPEGDPHGDHCSRPISEQNFPDHVSATLARSLAGPEILG